MERPKPRSSFEQVALVLQGGGALGAYQAGVYEVLSEAALEPDWLSGISIGAINAAIIAGNAREDRIPALRTFWERVTTGVVWPEGSWGETQRRIFNRISAGASVLGGQPGFFQPRSLPAVMQPRGAAGAISIYDTEPLRRTLLELVDFDRINAGPTRLSLGAVNIASGNFVYFDNADQKITPDHVMASGALPPGFPPVIIDGEAYWDGGLVSNTPLSPILDSGPCENTLVFQVDLFNARGPLPGDLFEVEQRRKQIVYSSRTRLNTDHFREMHALRRAIVELFERLPPEARQDEAVQALRELGQDHAVSIVHLIYHRPGFESGSSDYEFSRNSMRDHWSAGQDDARRTLRSKTWRRLPDARDGMSIFDIANDAA